MERWRVNLYTIWFSQVLSLMSFGFGVPFIPFYIQEMGIVDTDKLKLYTGILNAAPAITMGLMAPIWGILADKYGRKLMLLRAMLCATFILAGMGLVANAEQLIVLRLVQGLFTGTVTAANVMIAAGTPRKHLAYALGFLSSSQFIGSSFGPVLGGFFADFVGYRASFYLGGALMLIDFFLVLFIVKEEPIIQEIPDEENEAEKVGTAAVFTITLVAMLFILFFTRIARTIFNPYVPLFVQELQAGIKGAASTTGIINGITGLMTALSGVTLSRLGDKYEKKNVMLCLMASGILLSLPLSRLNNLWTFTAVYGIFFFAVGGIEPVIMSITAQSVPVLKRGLVFGVQALVGSMAWAVSPVIGSAVSINYSIQSILLCVPVFFSVALVTTFAMKKKERVGQGNSQLKPEELSR